MKHQSPKKQHFNLYYIFAEDKAASPMPPDKAERLRKELLKKLKNP